MSTVEMQAVGVREEPAICWEDLSEVLVTRSAVAYEPARGVP
jgi:hypothetical protein